MSGARKLQTEIDRVMKKIDEGVALFDEIWEKVYSAGQQNQKEKYEMDLKKEIKKLQRLRDQIKSWISSSEVKDKDALMDARRLIETKMEQFKICEKETKTKQYSKEGLARAEKLSPEDEAKQKTVSWISDVIEKLNQLVDERDVEIERLSAGKGKKSNKHIIEEYNQYITNHKFHISKLEGIMRLVNNDRLECENVDNLKEDLEYYLEAYEDDDYIQSYDEDFFYETLALEGLDIVNVDRVTQPVSASKRDKSSGSVDDDSSERSGSRSGRTSKKLLASSGGMIPLTIGRARVSKDDAKEKTTSTGSTPTKGTSSRGASDTSSVGSSGGGRGSHHHGTTVPSVPAPTVVHKVAAPPGGGASMAAILKREGEQQEKERQQKALQQAQAQQQQQLLLREQQQRAAAAQAEQLRQQQQQQLRQQQEAQLRQQEAIRQQQQAQQQQAAQQEAMKRQQQQAQQLQEQQARQQEAAAKQHQQLKAAAAQQASAAQQQAAAQQQQDQQQIHQSQQQQQQASSQGAALDNLLTSGLGGLSLGVSPEANSPNNNAGTSSSINASPSAVSPQQQQPQQQHQHPVLGVSFDASSSYLGALNDSFLHCPSTVDSERQRSYTPRNPYPTPSSYPSTPSLIFENPGIFEKLGTDCLFFIFYYAQGTYQQYLAARELKKQSWRYHKKYMTWFQRHEEPKITTDEYEQGTYVYFDYETGWCQRIKSDFRFEYSFLEDSLII